MLCRYFCKAFRIYGLVAQLNRASDSGSECRGFESRRGHNNPLQAFVISCFVS